MTDTIKSSLLTASSSFEVNGSVESTRATMNEISQPSAFGSGATFALSCRFARRDVQKRRLVGGSLPNSFQGSVAVNLNDLLPDTLAEIVESNGQESLSLEATAGPTELAAATTLTGRSLLGAEGFHHESLNGSRPRRQHIQAMRVPLTFVKNKLNQVSLVAAETFKKGQVVFDLDMGEFSERPNLRTIELGPHEHVDHPWGRYTNHHCEPTCYVDKFTKTMKAKRDIIIGEEITFNYMESETNISTSFTCKCGSAKCLGVISGPNSQPSHLEQ